MDELDRPSTQAPRQQPSQEEAQPVAGPPRELQTGPQTDAGVEAESSERRTFAFSTGPGRLTE